jgi:GH25 family lysozyme M1 (1,4-beta-N-acetylmuramidase)
LNYNKSHFFEKKLYDKKPKIKWWDFFVLWQYTSKAKIEGIKGNVDRNVGYISLETLKKYGKK